MARKRKGSAVRAGDVFRVLVALPRARRWIRQLLSSHEAEAQPATSFGFPQLELWFPGELFRGTRVVVVDQAPVLPVEQWGLGHLDVGAPVNVAGITFQDTFFVRRDAVSASLFFHELIHVVQWRELGFGRFALLYGMGVAGHGYRQSPLEAMAYDLQARFSRCDPPLDAEADVRRRTRDLVTDFRRGLGRRVLWRLAPTVLGA